MDQKKPINSHVQSTISDIFAAARKKGIDIEQAYLFGSHAKGTATTISDIDICVVSPSYKNKQDDILGEFLKITSHLSTPVDVIPMTPEDLAEKYSTIAKEIRTTGIQLL